jgi:hypothetical protein
MSLARFLVLTVVLSSGGALALEPPWGNEKTLRQRMLLEATSVCTDGQEHYAVAVPTDDGKFQFFYGDGRQFFQIPRPADRVLPGWLFLEPRFVDSTANDNYHGRDLRPYGTIKINPETKTCTVRCGTRDTSFKVLEFDKARELLRQATYEPSPQKYAPYALLRDPKGTYYLVDRGFHPSEQKSFRVFIGPRGDLKQQQMVNVISDSKGEIFSTKKGDLQLLLDREQPSMWIVNKKKKTELRPVPIAENLALIYNELGVYAGVRLGTPCDDQ